MPETRVLPNLIVVRTLNSCCSVGDSDLGDARFSWSFLGAIWLSYFHHLFY
jgi:hypothetical protein